MKKIIPPLTVSIMMIILTSQIITAYATPGKDAGVRMGGWGAAI